MPASCSGVSKSLSATCSPQYVQHQQPCLRSTKQSLEDCFGKCSLCDNVRMMAALLSCNAGDGLGSLCVCKGWLWLHEPLGSAVTTKCALLERSSLPLQRCARGCEAGLDLSFRSWRIVLFPWCSQVLQLTHVSPKVAWLLPAGDSSLLLFLSHCKNLPSCPGSSFLLILLQDWPGSWARPLPLD